MYRIRVFYLFVAYSLYIGLRNLLTAVHKYELIILTNEAMKKSVPTNDCQCGEPSYDCGGLAWGV